MNYQQLLFTNLLWILKINKYFLYYFNSCKQHKSNTLTHVNNFDFVKYTACFSHDNNAKKLDNIVRVGFDGF